MKREEAFKIVLVTVLIVVACFLMPCKVFVGTLLLLWANNVSLPDDEQ